ncbi:hypothetical protein BVX98_06375 [bacterium F11]|nr:hypothetical protein BVX98_06375 [bacterium F11]
MESIHQRVQNSFPLLNFFSGALIVMGLLFFDQKAFAVPDFTKESSIRISSASPQVIIGTYPSVRMYFRRNYEIRSATSADGVTWVEESGIRISSDTSPSINVSSVTGCSILELDAGGYRMLYSVMGTTSNYKIVSATSSDGLNWANESGIRVEDNGGQTFLGSPQLIELPNGNWRLYYIQDSVGSNSQADYRIYTTTSTDEGANWGTPWRLNSTRAGHVGAAILTNDIVRLFYTAPLTGETTNSQILSGLSTTTDGDIFSSETTFRLSTTSSSGSLSYPVLFRSTDTYQWRVYFNFTNHSSTSSSHIYSGVTLDPDPLTISPSVVNQADPAQTITITGEIFATTPTVTLTKTGETSITGTSINRTSDQTILATFDTNDKALGFWDIVVTNSNGRSATLSSALQISFSAATIVLTDNLFRPLKGESLSISVTIFQEGQTILRIYTFNGRLVKTISNQTRSSGTFAETWDGTNDKGEVVASGTYLLYMEGPKLDKTKKVVVIK